MFGIAEGRNVIFVTLESTQTFVINEKVNGQEITPFLNKFIQKSYYFDHFYQQTEQGKTSDSEFIVANSLYPSLSGSVFLRRAKMRTIRCIKHWQTTITEHRFSMPTIKILEQGRHVQSPWHRQLL